MIGLFLISGCFSPSCADIFVDHKFTEAANATATQTFLVAKTSTEKPAQKPRSVSFTLTAESFSTAESQATTNAASIAK
jgi:hypothetical protein